MWRILGGCPSRSAAVREEGNTVRRPRMAKVVPGIRSERISLGSWTLPSILAGNYDIPRLKVDVALPVWHPA